METLHWSHTTPVNDQLPLLIGQLEKQSGRSIARIGGEKGEKVVFGVVALLCCAAAVTLCDLFEIAGFSNFIQPCSTLDTLLITWSFETQIQKLI